MVINSFDTMVSIIAKTESEKDIKDLILSYSDKRVEEAISKSWSRARNVFRHAEKHRIEQLKKHVLEFDDASACLTLVEFTRFFTAIIEELKSWCDKDPSAIELVEDITDFMWSKIGAIKIDKRITYVKD